MNTLLQQLPSTFQNHFLYLQSAQTRGLDPGLPPTRGMQQCLLCLAQVSLNLRPLQAGQFLDKIAGQRQRCYGGATSCALCSCCTARLLPCFFAPSTPPCLCRAWADMGTTDASMGNREVAQKRGCPGHQETQAFGTRLGRSSEITPSAGRGKAAVERRV